MEGSTPPGWDHVIEATDHALVLVDLIFSLPELASERAKAALEQQGEDHSDDLDCGCWRAHGFASDLLQLLGRHFEAAIFLIRRHPGYAPAVATLARTVLEQSLRIAWLLTPSVVDEREWRALALEDEEWRFRHAVGTVDGAELEAIRAAMKEFLDARGMDWPVSPSVEHMANDLATDGKWLYGAYRMFSQPVHGTVAGANQFSKDVREAMSEYGRGHVEWHDSEFAAFPLLVMWVSASLAVKAYGDLLCPDWPTIPTKVERSFNDALRAVPENLGSRLASEERNREARELIARATRAVDDSASGRSTKWKRKRKG